MSDRGKHGNLGCMAVGLLAMVLAAVLIWSLRPVGGTAEDGSGLSANPYANTNFVYRNGFLTSSLGQCRVGIDVSTHQGKIDWQKVADAGVEFAFIRIGYRGYSEGGIRTDDRAAENIRQAQAAGLSVGVYFYSQAIDRAEALEEARFCIDFLEDYDIQLPVAFDWEYVSQSARTGSVGRTTLTECAKVFCEAIEDAGYQALIYFNPNIANTKLNLQELTDYGWWLSWYTEQLNYPYRVDFWQYTENGNVPGITGDVDIDLWFLYDD